MPCPRRENRRVRSSVGGADAAARLVRNRCRILALPANQSAGGPALVWCLCSGQSQGCISRGPRPPQPGGALPAG